MPPNLFSYFRGFNIILVVFATCVNSHQNTCPIVQYSGSFNAQKHLKDHGLVGNSYRNLTIESIPECFSACVQDCRCVSYQWKDSQCELMDESRHTAPDSYQSLPGYLYFELTQHFKESVQRCSSQCKNGCCDYQNPCKNGGTCVELCQNVTRKFECKCLKEFGGRVCEKPLSCASYGANIEPGNYTINPPNKAPLRVYCDAKSEPGIMWTLIESFAFSERSKYETKNFFTDYPNNIANPNWSNYRLSISTMKHIHKLSTLWRATCRFDTDGFVKTDHMRGQLNYTDIIETKYEGDSCALVDYINIRGIVCSNCTTHLRHDDDVHIMVDTNQGFHKECEINFARGAEVSGADNFGRYSKFEPNHRCAATPQSTTQWWLGAPV